MALILLFIACVQGESKAAQWVAVEWVVDGDTIVLTDGRHVRYIGIDTPEIDHKNNRAEPMAYKARFANRRLVEDRKIRLVYDREKKDRYGRTLAYVYGSGGLFVNAELLRQGFGHVLQRHPNTAKQHELMEAQRDAMKQGRGIWKLIDKNEAPAHAYLGNRRSKRFHTDDCPNGKRISSNNRIWLSSQWEAFWRGYAPAQGCIVFPPDQ